MQSRAIDQENFLARHPLNFLLFYGDYELINTIYLDDGSPLVDLSMELFNQSTNQTVKFQKPTNFSPSANNCHFYLSVEGDFTLERAPEGWEIAVEPSRNNTGDNFYFLKKEGYDLQPKPANGSTNKIVLVLKNFRAAPEGGTRTIRAEMFYGPLLKDRNNQPFQDGFGQSSSYGNTIFITNNRGGKKTLPLQVGFAKGNAVLNDGSSTNSLELLIANKNWPQNNLPLTSDSEFVISFEMGDTTKEGAVATEAQVKAIGITSQSNKWDVQHVANTTVWTVKPKSGTNQLASDETIKLNITNLVTNHSSGSGYLYVRYKNIPNYPDGQFVVPIEKTPLLYRNIDSQKLVGIGTNNPTAKLHVSGGDALISGKLTSTGDALIDGKVGIRTTSPLIDLAIGDNKTGLKQEANGKLAIYTNNEERVRIDENGNVGINKTTPLDKLHVEGNIRLSGNINGADQKLSIYSNTTAGNSNAWIELWGKTNNDSNRTGELSLTGKYIEFRYNSTDSTDGSVGMRLTSEGKVGIGTTSPTHQLHIKGQNSTLRLEGQGTYGVGATLNFGDNQEVYIKEDEDRKLLIHADTRISLDSPYVGIGTNAPSAKLDVNGSVKLGEGSTGWNRIICGKVIVRPGVSETQWRYYGKGISMCIRTAKTGFFRIYFEKTVDPEKMVIIATTEYSYADNFVSVTEIHSDQFTVQTRDRNGSEEDASFHFIAIELTENFSKLLNS